MGHLSQSGRWTTIRTPTWPTITTSSLFWSIIVILRGKSTNRHLDMPRLMGDKTRNTLTNGKMRRFFTSLVFPVDPSRSGDCMRCGACCKFVVKCPLLKEVEGSPGTYKCRWYAIRPPQCRKYPRSKREQVHEPCGYRFGK